MITAHPRTVFESEGAVIDGVRQMMPAAIGVLPFATMIGVAVGESSLSNLVGFLAGLVVAGGSAHLALTASITVGAGFLATVATALMINARSLIYGAALAPHLRTQPRWFRWVAAYALVDQLYALVSGVTHRSDRYVRSYYLSSMTVLWSAYMAGVGAGILLGPVVPPELPLSLAIPIMFLAMLLPTLDGMAARLAAISAALTAVLGAVLPAGTGMILAIVVGTAVGTVVEARRGS